MVLRMANVLAVMAAMLTGTQAVRAQDAGEITRQAVAAMERVTEGAQDDIQGAAATGIGVIQRLDANGAEDRQMVAAAHRTWNVIDTKAHEGDRRVNMLAARAVEALRQINADRRFFGVVAEARNRSHEAIGQAHRRATHAVQVALDEALDH